MTDLYATLEDNFREIPLLLINECEENLPRKTLDVKSLSELSQSIAASGLTEPVTVRKSGECYELVSGQRRLLAARMAGVYSIPCIITETDDANAYITALSSNLHSSPMNYFDIARAIAHIVRDLGFSEEYTAKKIGKTTLYVKEKLKLLVLPEYIQSYILENRLKERHTRCLLRLDDEKLIMRAAMAAVKAKMNVGQLDAYVDKLLEKKGISIGFCRDLRLYINTINHTVNIMKNSGINTMLEKVEDETSVIYRIVISK